MFSYSLFIYVLSAVFCCYVMLFAYNYFSETKKEIKLKEIIIIIFTGFFIVLNNLYNLSFLRIPGTILITTFFYYLIYKHPLFNILALSSFILFLSLITEFLLSILVSIGVSDLISINNNALLKLLFSLINFWIFYFFYKVPFIKNLYTKIEEVVFRRRELVMHIYTLIFLISFLYLIYALDYENILMYVISLLIVVLFSYISFNYFKELYNNRILNIKNKNLIESELLFRKTLEDYRILRHNLLNDFIFISSLCSPDIQKIINQKTKKYHANINNLNDLSNIPEGLQGILYFKNTVARNNGVEFYIDCNTYFESKELTDKLYIDTCEVISIVLDNAIEAASCAINKAVYFNLTKREEIIIFEILNTYSNPVDLDNIGNKNYSTKNRQSGLGLSLIKTLNSKIKFKKSIINDLFKVVIYIQKK